MGGQRIAVQYNKTLWFPGTILAEDDLNDDVYTIKIEGVNSPKETRSSKIRPVDAKKIQPRNLDDIAGNRYIYHSRHGKVIEKVLEAGHYVNEDGSRKNDGRLDKCHSGRSTPLQWGEISQMPSDCRCGNTDLHTKGDYKGYPKCKACFHKLPPNWTAHVIQHTDVGGTDIPWAPVPQPKDVGKTLYLNPITEKSMWEKPVLHDQRRSTAGSRRRSGTQSESRLRSNGTIGGESTAETIGEALTGSTATNAGLSETQRRSTRGRRSTIRPPRVSTADSTTSGCGRAAFPVLTDGRRSASGSSGRGTNGRRLGGLSLKSVNGRRRLVSNRRCDSPVLLRLLEEIYRANGLM